MDDNAKSESWQDKGEIVKKPEEGHIISKKGYSKITLEGLTSEKGNVKKNQFIPPKTLTPTNAQILK